MTGRTGVPSINTRPHRPADVSWHPLGACRDEDDTLFYHPENERGGPRQRRIEAAKAICRACPVMTQCLEDARNRREPYGTWGGESEDERREWLKENRPEGIEQDPEPEPEPIRRPFIDGTPCKRCGATMRTRRKGRNKLTDLPDGEVFHRAHGECQTCYQASRRGTFTARWELTDLGTVMNLALLIDEACDGRVQEAARAQGVELRCAPHELTFRIDSAAGQLVATGPARPIEQGAEVAA